MGIRKYEEVKTIVNKIQGLDIICRFPNIHLKSVADIICTNPNYYIETGIDTQVLEACICNKGKLFSRNDITRGKSYTGEIARIEIEFKDYIDNILMKKIQNEPVKVKNYFDKKEYYIYGNWIYKTDREYTPEETKLMILELEDQERQKFERLKKKHSLSEKVETKSKRDAIPEQVRVAVWRRDEGKCAKCSSRDKLEYDHIIPVSKGGSNTVRNIELLCETCNRKKTDNIE